MGRPTKPLIEKDKVVKTALSIIDELGPDRLNMRELGKRLNINPSSLYHHFRNKDEILDAVSENIMKSVKLTGFRRAKNWQEMAIELACAFRAVIVAHPNASMLVTSRRASHRPALVHPIYEQLLDKMRQAGFSEERSLFAMITLEILASGSALEEAHMGRVTKFSPVDPLKHPTLESIVSATKLNVRSSFKDMCRCFLLGLEKDQLEKTKGKG